MTIGTPDPVRIAALEFEAAFLEERGLMQLGIEVPLLTALRLGAAQRALRAALSLSPASEEWALGPHAQRRMRQQLAEHISEWPNTGDAGTLVDHIWLWLVANGAWSILPSIERGKQQAPASEAQRETAETGWLIERPAADGLTAEWWGLIERDGKMVGVFTADSLHAIRFVRWDDAERVIALLFLGLDGYIVTEHQWG